MKSLRLLVLCYIFSIVSGFSPLPVDRSSSSSGSRHRRGNGVATDEEKDDFQGSGEYIAFEVHYLFERETHRRTSSSKDDSKFNNILDEGFLMTSHHSIVNVDIEKKSDEDDEYNDSNEHADSIECADDTDEQSTGEYSLCSIAISDGISSTVHEKSEATNIDRRMHALGMISVHCEMEMLKFK
jgi:hypothetical protein